MLEMCRSKRRKGKKWFEDFFYVTYIGKAKNINPFS